MANTNQQVVLTITGNASQFISALKSIETGMKSVGTVVNTVQSALNNAVAKTITQVNNDLKQMESNLESTRKRVVSFNSQLQASNKEIRALQQISSALNVEFVRLGSGTTTATSRFTQLNNSLRIVNADVKALSPITNALGSAFTRTGQTVTSANIWMQKLATNTRLASPQVKQLGDASKTASLSITTLNNQIQTSATKFTVLNKALTTVRPALTGLKDSAIAAQAGISKIVADFEVFSKSLTSLNAKLNITNAGLRRTATEASNTGSKANGMGAGFISAGTHIGGLYLRVTGLQLALSTLGHIMDSVARSGSRFLAGMVTQAADFERAVTTNIVIMGAAADGLGGKLRDTILQLGKDTIFSSQQVADASLVLTKAGQDASAQIQGVLKATAQVASASQESMTDVATTMTTALAVFNKTGADAVDVGNEIVKTVNASKSDLNSYAEALTNAGSALSLMNVKQKDFDALVAFMSQRGFGGSATGTSILYFISRLVPTTQVAFNLMKQFGLITVNTSQLMKDFGSSIGDVNAPAEELLQKLYELHGGEGKLNEQTDSDIAKFDQWAVSMGYLNSKFFDMNGNLKDMSTVGQILSDTFSNLPKSTQIQDLAKILGSRGGGGTKVAGSLVDAFSSGINPITEWTKKINESADAATVSNAVVQTLAGRIEYLKSTIETLRIAFAKVFEGPARQILDFFSNLLNNLTTFIQENPRLAELAGTFIALSIAIAAVTAPVALLLALLPSFAGALSDLIIMAVPLGGILSVIGAAVLGLKDSLTDVNSTLGNVIQHVAQQLGDLLPKALSAFSNVVHNILEPAGQSIVGFIQNQLLPGFVTFATWLVDNLPAAIQTIANAWTTVFAPAIANTWNFVTTNVFPIIRELATWLGTNIPVFIAAAGRAWETVLAPAMRTAWDIIRIGILPALKGLGDFLHNNMVPVLQIAAALFVLWRLQLAATWVQQRLLGIWTAVTSIAIQQSGEKTLLAAAAQKTWNGLIILGNTIMKLFGVTTAGTTIALNIGAVATRAFGLAINFVKLSLGPIAIALTALTIVIGLLKTAWDNNFLGIRDIVASVAQFIGDKLGWLGGVVKLLGDVIGAVFGGISGAADDLANGVDGGTKKAGKSLDDLASKYDNLGTTILDNSPIASDISQPFADAATQIGTSGTDAATNYSTNVSTGLTNSAPTIKTAMDALVQPLRDFAASGGSGEAIGKAAADSIASATTAELRSRVPEVARTVQELIQTSGKTPTEGGFVTGANPDQKKMVDAFVGSLIIDLQTEWKNKSAELGDSNKEALLSSLPVLQEAAKYVGGDVATKFGDAYKTMNKQQLEEAYQQLAQILEEAPTQADVQNGLQALYNAFDASKYENNPAKYMSNAAKSAVDALQTALTQGNTDLAPYVANVLKAMDISPGILNTNQLNSAAVAQGVADLGTKMETLATTASEKGAEVVINLRHPEEFKNAAQINAGAYTDTEVQLIQAGLVPVGQAIQNLNGEFVPSAADLHTLQTAGFSSTEAWSTGYLEGQGIHDADIQQGIQNKVNMLFVEGGPLYNAGFTPANTWSKGFYDGAGNYYIATKNVVNDTFMLLRVQINALNTARNNLNAYKNNVFEKNAAKNDNLVFKSPTISPPAPVSAPPYVPPPNTKTDKSSGPTVGNGNNPSTGGGGGGGGGTTISPAEAVAKTLKDVSDAIKSWSDAIKALRNTTLPADINKKVDEFVKFAADLIQKVQSVALKYKDTALTTIGNFADAGGKVVDFLSKYVTLMQTLNTPNFTIGPVVDKITTLVAQARVMMNLVAGMLGGPNGWQADNIQIVGDFADAGGKVSDFLMKFVDLNQKLNTPGFSIGPVVEKVRVLVAQAHVMMNLLGDAISDTPSGPGWTEDNAQKVGVFADNGGKVTDFLLKFVSLTQALNSPTFTLTPVVEKVQALVNEAALLMDNIGSALTGKDGWTPENIKKVADFSDAGAKVADSLVKVITLLDAVSKNTVNPDSVALAIAKLVKSLADIVIDVNNVVDLKWGGTNSPGTAIQAWSDTGGKAIDALAKLLTLLDNVSKSTVNPESVALNISKLVKSLYDTIQDVFNVVGNNSIWGGTSSPATAIQSWSDSGGKIVDSLSKLVTLVNSLTKLKLPPQGIITSLVSTLKSFIDEFNSVFNDLITGTTEDKGANATAVSTVADSAGKVIDSMTKALSLLSNMFDSIDIWKKNPAQWTSALVDGMKVLVAVFQQAVTDGMTISQDAVTIAGNIGTAMDALGKALDLLIKLGDFKTVSTAKIDEFIDGLRQIVNRLPGLLDGIASDLLDAAEAFGTKMAPVMDTMDKALSFFINLMGATTAKTSSKTGTTTTTEKSGFQGINPASVDEFIASLKYLIEKLKTGLLNTIAPEVEDLANAFATKIGPAIDVLAKALDIFIKLVPDSEGKGGLKTIDPNAIGALVGDLYLLLHHWHNLIIGGEFQGDFAERSAAFADTLGIVLDSIQKAVDLVASIQNVGGVDKVVGIFTQLANAMQQADSQDLPKISKDFTQFFTPIFEEFKRQGTGTDSDTVLYMWGNKDNRKAFLTHMWLDVEGKDAWRWVIGLAINGLFDDIYNYFTTWIPQLVSMWKTNFLDVIVQDTLNAVKAITDALSINVTITVSKTTSTGNQSSGYNQNNPPITKYNNGDIPGQSTENNNYYIRQVQVKQVTDLSSHNRKLRQATRNLG